MLRGAFGMSCARMTRWITAWSCMFVSFNSSAGVATGQAAVLRITKLKRYCVLPAGAKLELSCLRLGGARILHMPGELFVEYQLAAAQLRPDLTVAMAAYGDYGPGYIGTARAYAEGGYETRPDSSFVGPEAEAVLTDAVKKLLAR